MDFNTAAPIVVVTCLPFLLADRPLWALVWIGVSWYALQQTAYYWGAYYLGVIVPFFIRLWYLGFREVVK